MIIDVSSSTLATGFKKYIFDGKDGNRDAAKVIKIEGDFDLAESMKKNITRKKKSMNFVISLHEDDDVSDEKFIEIYNEIMDEMLVGMNREDVMICSAIHNDTDNKHIHVEVIDSHLVTNKPLELYMDRIAKDKERFFKIRDYVELKHNLRKTLNKNDHKPIPEYRESHFKKWIDEERLKDFDYLDIHSKTKTTKGRAKFKQDLMKYLVKTLTITKDDGSFLIESLEDLAAVIENKIVLPGDIKLKITNGGYNRLTDYDYLTITPTYGKPIRIEADIFGRDFYRAIKEDRLMMLQDNLRPKPKEISKINDIRKDLDELNEYRKDYTFKRLGKHSDPQSIYPKMKNEVAAEFKLDIGLDEKNDLDEVVDELKSEQIETLGKFNLLAPDLLDPLIVKEKSKDKIKFKSFLEDKLDVENGVYIVDTKEDSALKEASILNRIKERLLNDRKINEFVRANERFIVSRERIESRIDKTIGDISGRLSKIRDGIRGIKKTIKSKIIGSTEYVQKVFSESKKDDNVSKLTPKILKSEFNKLFESKIKDDSFDYIMKPNIKSMNEDLSSIIVIDPDEVAKIFDIKIKDFINDMSKNEENDVYKIDALNGHMHFKDRNDNDWYIIDKDDSQYLYSHTKNEIKDLFHFIKEVEHSTSLQTYSIIEKNSDLEQMIYINYTSLGTILLGKEDIKSFEDINSYLEEHFDKFIKIRFSIDEMVDDKPEYIFINDIRYKISDTVTEYNNLDGIEWALEDNNAPKSNDDITLEQLMEIEFKIDDIENKNKSKTHHK